MFIRNRLRAAMLGALALSGTMALGQPSGGLVPDGVPADVALVFTGDTIGYIEPCG